ncbi:hypothetical protein [Nocardia testacea]|uniref:hypothetical protein n=1 Tax=Nocardia testacea TaxID=248551 RepID=UPI00058497D7|nr:hypothetical protein [Nocardia testacea]
MNSEPDLTDPFAIAGSNTGSSSAKPPTIYVHGEHVQELCDHAGLDGGLEGILGADGLGVLRADYESVGWADTLEEDTPLYDLPWVPLAALNKALPDFSTTPEAEAAWCAENGHDDPNTYRAKVAELEAAKAVHRSSTPPVGMILPREFWERRGFLRHIRQAAHARDESPHGVLLSVLALLSAHMEPSVTLNTGIKSPLPLNMFVGLVATSGSGKSSDYKAAKRLLHVTLSVDPHDAAEVPRMLGMGSGPGIAQAYMGVPAGAAKGARQEQVRNKLFLHKDEGGEMLAQMVYSGSSLAPALRSAWSGELEGQANAGKEAFRNVKDCVLGVAVGFQREVLSRLLSDAEVEAGTPQRFLFGSVTDPYAPDIDDVPDDPGVLKVGPLPTGGMELCPELRRAVRVAAIARRRGLLEVGRYEGQKPAMVARTAALLVILDCLTPDSDREWNGLVLPDDWDLAEALFAASVAVQEDAAEWAREQKAEEEERKAHTSQLRAVATAAAVAKADDTLQRIGDRILSRLPKNKAPVQWSKKSGVDGLHRKAFKGAERGLAQQALENLITAGQVVSDPGRTRIGLA